MTKSQRERFAKIPLEFSLKHRQECVDACDDLTPMLCFCGRIATGLHTMGCSKFRDKVDIMLLNKYENSIKSVNG